MNMNTYFEIVRTSIFGLFIVRKSYIKIDDLSSPQFGINYVVLQKIAFLPHRL